MRYRVTVAARDYPGAITWEWSAESPAHAERDVSRWTREEFGATPVNVGPIEEVPSR